MDGENGVKCPKCQTVHFPQSHTVPGSVYQIKCVNCDTTFKFRCLSSVRSSVSLTINGKRHELNTDIPATMSLNEFIREIVNLKGTKVMCREGGCGSCIVMASHTDPSTGEASPFAVNSCLTPVLSCDGWAVTTIEGLGNRLSGYHPIQKAIVSHNATQCGFCTPGFVMNMGSLLAENPKPTAEDIEKNFDGNICRCTGYRSILDAMKSFAVTGEDGAGHDIEDLVTHTKTLCSGSCSGDTQAVCSKSCSRQQKSVLMPLRAAVLWQKPSSLDELYEVMDQCAGKKVRYVVGNTSTGIYKNDGPYDVYVDTKAVKELYEVTNVCHRLSVGANVSLTQLIQLFTEASSQPEYPWGGVVARHLSRVANRPVRNAASWSGNLMTKFYHPEFPSDVFLLLCAIGAQLTICSKTTTASVPVENLLSQNMDGKVIVRFTLGDRASTENSAQTAEISSELHTYKIMPRAQNAHAYVNAAFMMNIDKTSMTIVGSPKILFGGISKDFLAATKTQDYLANKCLNDPATVRLALTSLASELLPDSAPASAAPKYRTDLAVALLYKCFLSILGKDRLPAAIASGAEDLERPLSSGSQDYSTDTKQWPLTEPMPKVEALLQASGEAEYVNDIPTIPGQLYAAFVISTVGNATVASMDPSPALTVPGVLRFLSYKDIPPGGHNNFISTSNTEEIFCSGQVLFAGQSLGLIVAESQAIADAAAPLVKVTYSNVQPPVTDMKEAIDKKMFFPLPEHSEIVVGKPEEAISASSKVIQGEISLGPQYHFTMETQICLCVPKEGVLEVYPSAQGGTLIQSVIAQVLGCTSSKVSIAIRRIGGGYGGKLTRNAQVSAACAVAATVMDKPVKLMLNLNTNMAMVGKRYPYLATYRAGVDASGKLNGVSITFYGDHGCAAADSTVVSALVCADNAYYCPNWRLTPVAVRTHTASNTFCRAPATTPAIFIMETVMEHIATQLGRHPMDVKTLNLYNLGQTTPFGQTLKYCNIKGLVQQIQQSAKIADRMAAMQTYNQQNRWKKKGLGFVPLKYGVQWSGAYFNVVVSVYAHDGSVAIMHGGVEMGQGINTKAIQVCAHDLGIPMDLIQVRPFQDAPLANSHLDGGSITSELVCIAVQECCKQLVERLAPVKSPGLTWTQLVSKAFTQGLDLVARYWVFPQGNLQPADQLFMYNSYGVTVAEVELDVLTGESQITRVDILFDCGESKNPEIDIGQVEGAVVMGIGYWLLEQTKYDPSTGENLTNGTWEYKPPTSLDIPIDFRIQLLKNAPNPIKVIRSKAVGEPPLCMSSAVLFALKDAIRAARTDAANTEHFPAGPPTTVEKSQQLCLPDVNTYVIQ